MRHQPAEPAVLHARLPHRQGGGRRSPAPAGEDALLIIKNLLFDGGFLVFDILSLVSS